ncbi:MAG: RNA methyltransferase [Gemmataceae bacterium]
MKNCRVVLVRTEIAANIGSTARVMRNMGAEELVLVAPKADPLAESARQLATHHAFALLQSARIVPDLSTALADCNVAAATSSLTGGLFRRQTVGTPEEVGGLLVEAMPAGRVALVFGPEPHGLTNEEILACPHLIHIPADETYPALNLAQSVAICLYAVRRAWQRLEVSDGHRDRAAPEEEHRMYERLEEALVEIRYLRSIRGKALMNALRHLISRAQPSSMEVRLLMGLARQLKYVAERTRFDDQTPH